MAGGRPFRVLLIFLVMLFLFPPVINASPGGPGLPASVDPVIAVPVDAGPVTDGAVSDGIGSPDKAQCSGMLE